MATAGKMPAFFISHGSPVFLLELPDDHRMKQGDNTSPTAQWLRNFAKNFIHTKPTAILVISAHWEEAQVTLLTSPRPGLLYDYYGFPESTYKVKYPAPGAPDLAQKVLRLLKEAAIPCGVDDVRGWDHGLFIPFLFMFPDCDIPILQMSLVQGLDPVQHLAIGQALRSLRDEGVLIIGSGFSTHNMSARFQSETPNWAIAWDRWLKATVADPSISPNERRERLINWEKAPSARDAHPREEHFMPLHVVAGSSADANGNLLPGKVIYDLLLGVWSWAMFQFPD